MWIKGLARRRLVAERVGSRRRSQDKRQSVRHRGLRIEQFEERMLLSVAPTTVNDVLINQIGALYPQAPTSRAVATDNNGDFVVTWQQYDFNSAGGADSNIYRATTPTPCSGSICQRELNPWRCGTTATPSRNSALAPRLRRLRPSATRRTTWPGRSSSPIPTPRPASRIRAPSPVSTRTTIA